MLNIGVIGTGYVGLVQGVIIAEFGMNVICMDVVSEKIEKLKRGIVPIYEPGLKELLDKNVAAGRLHFSTDMQETVKKCNVIFIAVGTPPQDNGSTDLHYVQDVAKSIGKYMNDYKVIVDKSTVPVGTGKIVRNIIQRELNQRGVYFEFDVVSNPEFLREGKAVRDCLTPDRVVIGAESEKAVEIMKKVYDVLYINQTPFLITNLETAEMIKYASNAFLAVKISFINEMALLADKVGANIQEIARGMGMDGRISPKFLHAGPGYGGSCFPKDTKAIVDIAHKNDEQLLVIEAAIKANEKQKQKMSERIINTVTERVPIDNAILAIWGLSFKPETDDMRDAPSIDIIRALVSAGARIRAYCPQGMKEAEWRLKDIEGSITYCKNEYEAAEGADALILMTEWHQFRGAYLHKVKAVMKNNYFFDLRNVFAKNTEITKLFKYSGVGCLMPKEKSMKAMIMAAGIGSRLRPLTATIPKPMIPIVNKPVMEYCVKLLSNHGITDIIVNTHYLPESIQDHFLDGQAFGVNMQYSKEKKLLGTAGGVKNNKWFLNETFCIVSGDILTNINFSEMYRFHKEKNALVTLALRPVKDVTQYGVAVIDGDNKITAFQEKPNKAEALSNLVNTGVYIFEPEIFNYIPDGFYDFGKNLFPKLVKLEERIYGFEISDYWCDVGNIQVYKQANRDVLSGKYILNGMEYHPIHDSVELGKNCKVVNSIIGKDCVVRSNVKISNSIILENTIIRENAEIKNSIIGSNCLIEKGSKIVSDNVIESGSEFTNVCKGVN
jgi:UDPglucose 6-dehydrogenase